MTLLSLSRTFEPVLRLPVVDVSVPTQVREYFVDQSDESNLIAFA